jgi:hypothetical protein
MFMGNLGVFMGYLHVNPSVGFFLAKAFTKNYSMSMPSSNYPPTPCEVKRLLIVAIVG